MDIGSIERGVVIRLDGEGKMTVQHAGLTPVEVMGILAVAQGFLMDDLRLKDQKKPADDVLLDALRKAKAN